MILCVRNGATLVPSVPHDYFVLHRNKCEKPDCLCSPAVLKINVQQCQCNCAQTFEYMLLPFSEYIVAYSFK